MQSIEDLYSIIITNQQTGGIVMGKIGIFSKMARS